VADVFLDFEASSLARGGFPVEVAWVFDTAAGEHESHLIRPAPDWREWSAEAEAIHGLSREQLEREGAPHGAVARRMVEALSGHALFASAPSWDGQWLSLLLRTAGLPRRALRLRDTEEARAAAVRAALAGSTLDPAARAEAERRLLLEAAAAIRDGQPAHRALADARRELAVCREAGRRAAALAAGGG